MPMLAFVRHLTLIHANWVATSVTVFCVHRFEAATAERPTIPHDVPLATELCVTFEATEMSHVPTPSLRFRAFISEDNLVASRTARLQNLCMMSSAVNVAIFVKINEID